MKKLSQLLENKEDSTWEIKIELSLFVNAANEGEASFLAERALQNIDIEKESIITQVSKKDIIQK